MEFTVSFLWKISHISGWLFNDHLKCSVTVPGSCTVLIPVFWQVVENRQGGRQAGKDSDNILAKLYIMYHSAWCSSISGTLANASYNPDVDDGFLNHSLVVSLIPKDTVITAELDGEK